jgi:nicotinate phosphoribosyltransferase
VKAVRLDSGDLSRLAVQARALLDEAGLRDVGIFVSSGLDEYKIQEMVNFGAPIDGIGVGTKLAVVADAPELDMAYKLVEYAGKGRLKLSPKKLLYPGRKQVFRQTECGRMLRDIIGRFDEKLAGEPLLRPLLLGGQPVREIDVKESREKLKQELEQLSEALRSLEPSLGAYPIEFSKSLQRDFSTIRKALGFEERSPVGP